jgi:hypothetical protein
MAGGHVYVTISGFGKRIVPVSSPFEFHLGLDGAIAVTVGDKRTIITTARAPVASLSANSEVADVVVGPQDTSWRIDAGKFSMPFPPGWIVFSDGGVLPPFFLEGPLERTLFVQIANNIPTGDDLVATGQTVVARDSVGPFESLELAYRHEGRAWLQRHTVLTRENRPYAVLTAQAPAEVFSDARDLHVSIASSIVFARSLASKRGRPTSC